MKEMKTLTINGKAYEVVDAETRAAIQALLIKLEEGTLASTIDVEEIEGGYRLTITDADGEQSIDVMHGVKGEDGKDGTVVSISVSPTDTGNTVTITTEDPETGETTAEIFNVDNGTDGTDGNSITEVEVTMLEPGSEPTAQLSNVGLPVAGSVDQKLSLGIPGSKSAYAYAQAGGYTGTEEEFSKKLAEEAKAFYVYATGESEETDSGFSAELTTTKTAAEINSALSAGRPVYCILTLNGAFSVDNMIMPLIMAVNNVYTFIQHLDNDQIVVVVGDGLGQCEMYSLTSPNPNALTINGTVYDGSEEKNVQINGIHYIVGDSTTAGTWTGTCEEITEYFDGLTVAYKVNIAGASGGTTLNINGLGAAAVIRNASTAVTTTYPVGSLLLLTYTTTDNVGRWLIADYDANTKNSAGSGNKTETKLYLVGTASQSSSGTTSYSNANVYIGTDNCLYSGGAKVMVEDDVITLINNELGVIIDGAY